MSTRIHITPAEKNAAADFEELSASKREFLRVKRPGLYAKMERAYVRVMSLKDFYSFMDLCLKNPVLYHPLHGKLAEFVSKWTRKHRKKMVLLPRGHVKSNVITVSYPIWEILLNQDKRILLSSHKGPDAAKFMRTIRMYLESDRFNYYFPEILPARSRGKVQVWSDDAILIDRDGTFTENTIESSSLNAQVTGRHYSGLIADDWVTKDNVGNPLVREKTTDYRKLCESLLDAGAWQIVTGTRYHFEDEYGLILKENEQSKVYSVLHQPALFDIGIIHDYLSGKKKWKREQDFEHLLFPTRFTLDDQDWIDSEDENRSRKSLIRIYHEMGPGHFANQYMLEPFDPKKAIMNESMLLEAPSLPEENLDYYRMCDLSSEITSKHGESYTAIYTVAVSDRCDVYITDIFWGNYDPQVIVDELINGQCVAAQNRPKLVTMESGPYDRMLRPFLLRRGRELGVFVPVRQMTGAQHLRNKHEHIEGLIPWFKSGKIHYVRGCRNINILKEEMNKYGAFDRMDCLDALAQLPAMIFPTGSERFLTGHPTNDDLVRKKALLEEQRLAELNQPSIITFGEFKQQLFANAGRRKRLGADRIRKEFRTS